jgi:hypothetical protein
MDLDPALVLVVHRLTLDVTDLQVSVDHFSLLCKVEPEFLLSCARADLAEVSKVKEENQCVIKPLGRASGACG